MNKAELQRISDTKKPIFQWAFLFSNWWPLPDSNWGPDDYESGWVLNLKIGLFLFIFKSTTYVSA